MTSALLKKIEELLEKIKCEDQQNGKVSEEFLSLERLALEVQDYWDGYRQSRYFEYGMNKII